MSFWTTTTPRARKAHGCMLCHRTIEPGEHYSRGFGDPGSGDVGSWVECAHCAAWASLVDLPGRAMDSWGEGYGDEDAYEISLEPRDRQEAAWGKAYRRRWRDPLGRLVPVPTITREETANAG